MCSPSRTATRTRRRSASLHPGGAAPAVNGRRTKRRGALRARPDEIPPAAPASSALTDSKRAPPFHACCQCRHLKIQCVGGRFPCDRCWRLALNCRPQVLPPAPSAPSAADSSDGGPDTPGGEGERALASTSTIPTPLPPLLELAFARADPRTGAEFMTQAFVALHAAGRVVRERALFAMRLYRDMAQVVGSDPSWGFSGAIATALGCTPIDLEAPQELLLDPPPAQREAAVQARIAQMKAATEWARADPAFQELDERNPGAAILFAALTEDGSMAYATNAAFDAWFQSAEVFAGSMLRHKTLSTLLIATLIDPEDRKCFLEALTCAFFSAAPQREPMIIKAFDQRGEMGLFLLHIQAIGALAMAIRLERLPPSRHLTPRPGHRNNMHCFRRGDPGAAHTPFLHAVASFSAVPTAGQPVTPRVLPGLVAVACSLTDSEHMRGAAAAGAVSTAALDASLFDSCPISIPLPPSMIKLDGGGISTAGGSSASSNTAGGGHSITGGGGCGDGGGGDAATWPFRLPLPAAARACTLEGWDGVGVLAGDGQLGSIPVADLELLQAVFAEGEEGGGGGAVDVKVEV